jgi:hypothetical protein
MRRVSTLVDYTFFPIPPPAVSLQPLTLDLDMAVARAFSDAVQGIRRVRRSQRDLPSPELELADPHQTTVVGSTNEIEHANQIGNTPLLQSPSLETWNSPKENAVRLAAVYWSFFVCGANDAAYGVRIQISYQQFAILTSDLFCLGINPICKSFPTGFLIAISRY